MYYEYSEFRLEGFWSAIGGLLWLVGSFFYGFFIFRAIRSFVNLIRNRDSSSLENKVPIDDILDDFPDSYSDKFCSIILSSIVIILTTTIINVLHSYCLLNSFYFVFLVLVIFAGLFFIILNIINRLIRNISIKDQYYILICELTIIVVYYLITAFRVFKVGGISIPVSIIFWFYNGCAIISVLLVLSIILYNKRLLLYFALYNSSLIISMFIYSHLMKRNIGIGMLFLLLPVSIIISYIILLILKKYKFEPNENIYFPVQLRLSSFKSYLAILLFTIVVSGLLLYIIVNNINTSIEYKYNLPDGYSSTKHTDNLIIPFFYYIFIFLFYLSYMFFLIKNFISNVGFIIRVKYDLKKIKGEFGLSENMRLNVDDYGNLTGLDDHAVNEIINKNMVSAGLAIYDRIKENKHLLNMFLTCYILEHPNDTKYSVLKDNYVFFLNKYVETVIEPNNVFLDYIYFSIGDEIDYELKEEIIFSLLLEIRKNNEINEQYKLILKRFLENGYSVQHHNTKREKKNTSIQFGNIIDYLFKKNIIQDIDYNNLLKYAINKKNVPMIRELYYLNIYNQNINIMLMNLDLENIFDYISENYYNSIVQFSSVQKIENVEIPENFCIIENNSLQKISPGFGNYLYKKDYIDNTLFKFIINPDEFIKYLDSLYVNKDIIFNFYYKCLIRIIEDTVLTDVEKIYDKIYCKILLNPNHTYGSMYIVLKLFNMTEKNDAKREFENILNEINKEPFVYHANSIKTKANMPIPSLIRYTRSLLEKEKLCTK